MTGSGIYTESMGEVTTMVENDGEEIISSYGWEIDHCLHVHHCSHIHRGKVSENTRIERDTVIVLFFPGSSLDTKLLANFPFVYTVAK